MTIAHYSKFMLNSAAETPYFAAHVPEGFPLERVLGASRALRRLPPNLAQLSRLAKQWRDSHGGLDPMYAEELARWYDADGFELNPATGRRLTDEEIDAVWGAYPDDDETRSLRGVDIPLPEGGFADPRTWSLPPPEPSLVDRSGLTEAKILADIASRGRDCVIATYAAPQRSYSSDAELARAILAMHGQPWDSVPEEDRPR